MPILIVDDSAEMRRIISGILRRSGREVLEACSPAEAFRLLGLDESAPGDPPVDLIITDVQMPELDGIEACRRIKADERFQDVPVLVVTATAEEASLRQAFAAGASDYIQKPFKSVALLARVEHALRLKRETENRKAREAELEATRKELQAANEALRRLANLDGLTGIGNRRSFDEFLDREWRRARRQERPLALIMADIDFFKMYNDTYGHPAGDECLKQVARAFDVVLRRGGDHVFRYGGEEIAVLLADTDVPGAVNVAETLREAVADLEIRHETSAIAPHVTISLGVAALQPVLEADPVALVTAADQALYRAKQGGRNVVRSTEPHVAAG